MYASCAIEKTAFHFDKAFDYIVPPGMQVRVGANVKVPFGTGKPRLGVVLELHDHA